MDNVNQGDRTIIGGHRATAMAAGRQRHAARRTMPPGTPPSSVAPEQAASGRTNAFLNSFFIQRVC